ncbi:GNAT family N-acetyltransferase [Streptomyces sp. NPDC006798]|uniref:GNAT family N-acetyltransferase n=1 Tax=Streptomyces sp. NPDC006798 TaxID=3155462 RepID=UPI0033D2C81E
MPEATGGPGPARTTPGPAGPPWRAPDGIRWGTGEWTGLRVLSDGSGGGPADGCCTPRSGPDSEPAAGCCRTARPAAPGRTSDTARTRTGSGTGSGTPAGFAVTLCRDGRDFARLRDEWDDLRRRCSTATPFQSHAWLESWWRSYGGGGPLRVVLVRRDGRLVAAAPLTLVHRPMPLLVGLGGGISDYTDVLVADTDPDTGPSDTDAVFDALERGLRRAARHAVVELREVRPGAAAERLYERWTGARGALADSVCLELPAAPLTDLVERLPTPRAQRARAKLRKIDALGIEAVPAGPDEVPDAVARLLRLHELQWRGRGVTVEHLRPRFAEHLVRAARRMVRDGDAALTEYRLAGEVVAVGLTLASERMTGGYLYGADPGLRERRVDVATMLLRHETGFAAGTGRRVVSLLRGAEPYKNQWRPEAVTNRRLLMAPAALEPLLRLRTAQAGLRDRTARTVAERFPAAREWRDRLKDWQAAAVDRGDAG